MQEIEDLPEIEAEPVNTVPSQDLSDQGMPSLTERAAEIEVSRDGMPQNISIPKPAPIPEGIDVNVQPQQTPVAFDEPVSRVAEEKEQQKNASVGLITIIILVILALLAWLFFK
ncbi:hypothetical protein D3C79_762720 [compost metagenome]